MFGCEYLGLFDFGMSRIRVKIHKTTTSGELCIRASSNARDRNSGLGSQLKKGEENELDDVSLFIIKLYFNAWVQVQPAPLALQFDPYI